MKAIEILKELAFLTPKYFSNEEIKEALAELQQLESKSCEGGKYQIEVGVGVGSHRPNCIMCSRYYNDTYEKMNTVIILLCMCVFLFILYIGE